MSRDAFRPDEDRFWRALMTFTTALPRVLDAELQRCCSLSLSDFAVLLHLVEAGAPLRMADLATATGLSASRITRVVAGLQARDLVEKDRCSTDGRGMQAVVTDPGRQRFAAAYPVQVARARNLLLDLVEPDLLPRVTDLVEQALTRSGVPSMPEPARVR